MAHSKLQCSRHDFKMRYYINDNLDSVELQPVNEEKDLGVFITSNLKPSAHCLKSTAKTKTIIGLVCHDSKTLDRADFLLIYKTYIRPHLEYCVQAWSPHLTKDIQCLERVQKAATNLVSELKNSAT